jgi:hypothetical protein
VKNSLNLILFPPISPNSEGNENLEFGEKIEERVFPSVHFIPF